MRRITRAAITVATAGLVLVPATAAHADGAYVHFRCL
jgi:hypothetical protein